MKALAYAVSELISSGEIRSGERMPTTRKLAERLGMSPAAVSDAWKILISDGLLETSGRRGTFVVHPDKTTPWRQFRGVTGADLPVNLSTGFPDPELLIDIRPYLAALIKGSPYTGYPSQELDPVLGETLRPFLPKNPEEATTILFTHVLGGLAEFLPSIGSTYAKIMVADPEFAPYLDLLERSQIQPVPLPMDHEGMYLSAVKAAVEEGAKGIILQPRGHNPSGVTTSEARLQAIAEICAANDVWIIDGDYYGDLNPAPKLTAATWAPDHTIYVRTFSKELHPDIRVAIFSAPPKIVRQVRRRRVGGFEVSRINQDLLQALLSDDKNKTQIAAAKQEYQRRQNIFIATLAEYDIEVQRPGGFNVWVPVDSESDALVYLASKGIGVAPGSVFQVSGGSPHIRVSTATITGDVRSIADEIASATSAGRIKY